MQGPGPAPGQGRLVSRDVFRGATIAVLILELEDSGEPAEKSAA